MLTCRRLFRGASEAETFKNVLEMPIPPPSKQRPEVPPSLDAIVLRALARDREKRYETGQAFADDLEEVMRETKWKSRMLPGMLADLFGSSIHSSQIALSCLTPEMLAAAGAATGTGTGLGAGEAAPRPWLRSWRLWAVVVGGLAVAALGAFFGLGLGRVTPPPPLASPPVRMSPPAPEPAVPPPAAAVAPGPAAVDSVPAAAEPAKKPGPGKKPSRAATRKSDRPIVRGLSIDPFAEAAKRKPR
jgi:serine/threonine-protein kinase